MKGTLVAVAAVSLAMAIGMGGAAAKGQVIGDFLTDCKSDAKLCNLKISDVILAAKSARYACVPHALSLDDAAQQELAWLQKSAEGSERFASQNTEDALFDGVNHLWPCGKG